MSNEKRAAVLALVVAGAVVACTFLDPLSDLSNAPPQDGGVTDGADASSDGDPCATAVFCDDFERVAPRGDWDDMQVTAGGELAIDTSTAAGGRASLRATLGLVDASASAAWLRRSVPLPPNVHAVTFAYAFRIDGFAQRDVHAQSLGFGASPVAFLELRPDGAFLAEQIVPSGAITTYTLGAIEVGVWHHLVATLDGSKMPSHALVTVDGMVRSDEDLKLDFTMPSPLVVTIGDVFASAGPGYVTWFDDVRLTTP